MTDAVVLAGRVILIMLPDCMILTCGSPCITQKCVMMVDCIVVRDRFA